MLILLLATTAYAQEETRITVPYERFVLPNGLNVILHEDHTTPTVTVNIWYHVGSGREKPGRTGFAHLFEHIMFEGSRHVPEGKFDEWLEAAGGSNNASTNQDVTNYYEDVPSNALELALFLDSDRMLRRSNCHPKGRLSQRVRTFETLSFFVLQLEKSNQTASPQSKKSQYTLQISFVCPVLTGIREASSPQYPEYV